MFVELANRIVPNFIIIINLKLIIVGSKLGLFFLIF